MTISLVQLFQYTSGIILPAHQWFVSTNGCFNKSQCNSYLNTIFDKSKHTECMNVPLCVNNINDGLLFIIIALIATKIKKIFYISMTHYDIFANMICLYVCKYGKLTSLKLF